MGRSEIKAGIAEEAGTLVGQRSVTAIIIKGTEIQNEGRSREAEMRSRRTKGV